MDEPDNNLDQACAATLLLQGDSDFSFRQLRVTLLDLHDPDLQQALVDDGALLVDANEADVDVIVFDPATVNSDMLRMRISAKSAQRLQDGAIQVIGHPQLVQYFDQQSPGVHRLVTRSMLADMLDVSVATIRSWQRRGLIQRVSTFSKLDYFDFQEVSAAKQLAMLVDLGMSPATIQQNLQQLARWMPNVDRPLNQLSVLVDGKKILLRQNDGLVEAGGQRRLDFAHPAERQSSSLDPDSVIDSVGADDGSCPEILPFTNRSQIENHPSGFETRIQYLQAAEALEETGDFVESIEVYRSCQLAFGPDPEVCLRIGELLFRLGDLRGARERYYMAIELDESLIEARAALGCVLVELGESDLAVPVFQGALNLHPDYADVHFQLARSLQSAGEGMQAIKHWNRFIELSPAGPWTDEAKSQVAFLRRNDSVDHSSLPDS